MYSRYGKYTDHLQQIFTPCVNAAICQNQDWSFHFSLMYTEKKTGVEISANLQEKKQKEQNIF